MFQQFFAGRTIVILSVVAGCTPRNVINFSMQMEPVRVFLVDGMIVVQPPADRRLLMPMAIVP